MDYFEYFLAKDPTYQEPVYFVPKGWGHERWLVNNDKYCGKLLYFVTGKKCSYHYHLVKDECFYLHKGVAIITYGETDDITLAKQHVLKQGQTFKIPPGLRHQIEAIEDTELFEFSTHHEDSDSYRVIRGD